MAEKPTVLYIISDRRSGSTLLENILSKSEEVVSVGELAMLHGHILREGPGERWNWNCSCGQPLEECELWSGILDEVYTDPSTFNTNISWNFKSKKLMPVTALPGVFKNRLLKIINNKKNKQVASSINGLYNAIFAKSGKQFIIDSSKDPLQALTIYRSKRNFDMKIIWLKRDLRAIAVSKSKWKELNVKKQKSLTKILLDVFYYRRICTAAAYFFNKKDFLDIRYESLAQQTQEQLNRITGAFGMQNYMAPEFMYVEDDHTIGGTPNRFAKRPIVLEESWKKSFENKKLLNVAGGLLTKF